MSSTLSNVIIFTTGAAIGALMSWKLLEMRYKQIADEEIESVKAVYSKKDGDVKPKEFEPEQFEPQKFKPEYTNLVNDLYSGEKEGEEVKKKPYIIMPEEFGEHDDWEAESLTYYADGVLTDNRDEPIEDVEKLVGKDFESHFGEYEEDSVFIRNEQLKTDYEILAVAMNYSDIVNTDEHPTED